MEKLSQFFFFLFAILLALPLMFTPSTMYPWLFGKTIIFQILLDLAAVCFLVWGLKYKTFRLKKLNALDISIFVFLAFLVITALLGENPTHSWWGNQTRSLGVFTWLHFGLFYFFLTHIIQEEKKWMRLFSIATGVAVAVGLTAVFQSLLPVAWSGDIGGDRYSGILGNPAFFASFILVGSGIAFFLFFKEQSRLRFLFLLAGIFLAFCVLMSGIRGAFAGLLVGVLFFIVSLFFLKPKNKNGWVLRGGGLLLFLTFVGMFFASSHNLRVNEYLPFSLTRLRDFSWDVGTGHTRLLAWEIAWKGFVERPLVGWGWGNYDVVFHKYYSPAFFQYSFQETQWDKPHNAVLEILTTTGVFGALAYLAVFGTALFALFSVLRGKTVQQKKSYLIVVSVLLAYGVQNFFLFDTTNVLILVFLILGYISFAYKHDMISVSVHGTKRIIFSFLVLLCMVAFYRNVLLWKESHTLKTTLDASNILAFNTAVEKTLASSNIFQGESAVLIADKFTKLEKSNTFNEQNMRLGEKSALLTATTLEKKASEFPSNISYPFWSAQVYLILAQFKDPLYYDKAITLLKQAEAVSPQKQEVYFLLGRTYLLKKDFPNALAAQEKAVLLDPTIAQSYWFWGLTKVGTGDTKGGLEIIEQALQKGFFPTTEQRLYIIDLYAQLNDYKKIIEHYKIFVEMEPTNIDWYVRLATAYALAGEKEFALETVNKAVEMYPPLKVDADKFIEQYNLK